MESKISARRCSLVPPLGVDIATRLHPLRPPFSDRQRQAIQAWSYMDRSIAALLADLLRRNLGDDTVTRFSFRAVRPLFDLSPFWVSGRIEDARKTARLWASDSGGGLSMEATATLA